MHSLLLATYLILRKEVPHSSRHARSSRPSAGLMVWTLPSA